MELSRVLDEESERMGVSVNALVNMILKRYSEFTRFLSKIDLVVVNRELLKSLFDSYPDDDIYGLGVSAGEVIPRDTILFWKKTLNFETVLEYIEKIICRYREERFTVPSRLFESNAKKHAQLRQYI